MKRSSMLLVVLLVLFMSSLLASMVILRHQYDKIDKRDPFWNYNKIKEGSFHHLKVDGGNLTRIAFRPSAYAAVGVLNYWSPVLNGKIQADIVNDTLYLRIEPQFSEEKIDFMRQRELISISCPELSSIDGINTQLTMNRLQQKNLIIRLAGHSRVDIKSYNTDFDTLITRQKDASNVTFVMSDEISNDGVMRARQISADLEGRSSLNIGQFHTGALHYTAGDTSMIVLSGATLRQLMSARDVLSPSRH